MQKHPCRQHHEMRTVGQVSLKYQEKTYQIMRQYVREGQYRNQKEALFFESTLDLETTQRNFTRHYCPWEKEKTIKYVPLIA